MNRQHMLQSVQCSSACGVVRPECCCADHLIGGVGNSLEETSLINSTQPAQKTEDMINPPSIALRICRQCKKEKPETEEFFQPAKHYPKELHTHCRECRAQYFKDWREKKDPEYLRRKAMRELYNTTIEWYDKKLEEQGGHCALCEATQFTHRKRLCVDHDHSCCEKRGCGKCNRGILCATCNYKMGQLEFVLKEAIVIPRAGTIKTLCQEETWISKALRYLKKYEGLRSTASKLSLRS